MKASIYFTTSISQRISRIIAEVVDFGVQEDGCNFVEFRPARCRKNRLMVQYMCNYLLIVTGESIDPDEGAWVKISENSKRSKYNSQSSKWINDFEGKLNHLIESGRAKIVADLRPSVKEVAKLAKCSKLYVGFAWIRDGEVVYRDSIRADSVESAIEVRFGGKLPDGFIVEKVVETPEIAMLPPGSSF